MKSYQVAAVAAIGLMFFAVINSASAQDAQSEVEERLAVSKEAAKEVAVDLREELNLPATYDPIVPTGVFGKLAYPLKKAARAAREGVVKTFQSEEKYAKVVQRHAQQEMAEAAKVYQQNPKDSKAVVGMLEQYQKRMARATEAIGEVAKKNEQEGRALAEEMAKKHLLVMPKVMEQMRDGLADFDPAAGVRLEQLKQESLRTAGRAVTLGAPDPAAVAELLQKVVHEKRTSAFSGFAHAEVLSETRDQLKDHLPAAFQQSFDQAISGSLKLVEDEYRRLAASSEEERARQFAKYVEQLPGQDISRIKILEQFKSQADLPPEAIAKMQEAKARVAEVIGEKIERVADEDIRKQMTRAFLEFKNPGLEDLKAMEEMKDLIPHKQIRQQIADQHETQVKKFLDRFGADGNARAVTEEFDALARKVKNGELAPDANFFKIMESLRARLSPEQQVFIGEMEETGKQEMARRMKNDPAFAERFSTFNPADAAVFERIGPPPGFEEKFREIEKQQAENFKRYLQLRNDPEEVREIRERFATEVPEEVREKFEQQFNFHPEQEFSKHEEFAREKEEFFREKHGREFPGQGQPFTNPGFFPPRGAKPNCPEGFRPEGANQCVPDEQQLDKRIGEDRAARERGESGEGFRGFGHGSSEGQQMCERKGGQWNGKYCDFGLPGQERYTPKPDFDEGELCRKKGGTWTGQFCQIQRPGQKDRHEEPRFESQPQERFSPPAAELRPLPPSQPTEPRPPEHISQPESRPEPAIHLQPAVPPPAPAAGSEGGAVQGVLRQERGVHPFSFFEVLIPWR